MNYSSVAVSALASYHKLSLGVVIKRNAELAKFAYVLWSFLNKKLYSLFVAKSRARHKSILDMRFINIIGCYNGSYSALRKPRIRFFYRCFRYNRNFHRRVEMERRIKPRYTGAYDEHVGFLDRKFIIICFKNKTVHISASFQNKTTSN